MELSISIRDMESILRPLKYAPEEMQKAIRQSLSRGGSRLASQLSRQIRLESFLKAGEIRAALGKPVITGGMGHMAVDVRVSGKRLPLDHFKLFPRRMTARKGRRSTSWPPPVYQIGPREPKTAARAEDGFSKPFITRFGGGKLLLMHAKGKSLSRIYRYSVQYFAAFTRVEKPVLDEAGRYFRERLEHEVDYRLGRLLK